MGSKSEVPNKMDTHEIYYGGVNDYSTTKNKGLRLISLTPEVIEAMKNFNSSESNTSISDTACKGPLSSTDVLCGEAGNLSKKESDSENLKENVNSHKHAELPKDTENSQRNTEELAEKVFIHKPADQVKVTVNAPNHAEKPKVKVNIHKHAEQPKVNTHYNAEEPKVKVNNNNTYKLARKPRSKSNSDAPLARKTNTTNIPSKSDGEQYIGVAVEMLSKKKQDKFICTNLKRLEQRIEGLEDLVSQIETTNSESPWDEDSDDNQKPVYGETVLKSKNMRKRCGRRE